MNSQRLRYKLWDLDNDEIDTFPVQVVVHGKKYDIQDVVIKNKKVLLITDSENL